MVFFKEISNKYYLSIHLNTLYDKQAQIFTAIRYAGDDRHVIYQTQRERIIFLG